MTSFTVVLDACVLYPATLRDLLVELARTGAYRAKWSATIHDEWIRAAIRKNPALERDRLLRVVQLMDTAVLDANVSGFESLVPALGALPDPDDRHVVAAAIHCGAQEIVTYNLRDFPEAVLQPYGIRAIHPDAFVEHVLDLNAEAVCEAVRRVRARLKNPPQSAEELLASYERIGLAISASILRERILSL